MRALLLGGTGETGKEVLKVLLRVDSYTHVTLVGRRKISGLDENPKVKNVMLVFSLKGATYDALSGRAENCGL